MTGSPKDTEYVQTPLFSKATLPDNPLADFVGRKHYHEMVVLYEGLRPFAQKVFRDGMVYNMRKIRQKTYMSHDSIQFDIEYYLNNTAIIGLRELAKLDRQNLNRSGLSHSNGGGVER